MNAAKVLYATRGIGSAYGYDVYISLAYKSTMLYELSQPGDECSPTWKPTWVDGQIVEVCYEFFHKCTGITLEPGEYTTIKVEEVP